ncbi:DUF2946 family protein [Marinomonas gallaica]|uniref:DUF2946 family protein n=1 Tax=Marinomonas gallaica TaxID=1806667 RepID=UPI003A91D380
MKQRTHFFLILCWLAYFAVPLVNGIGQSGAQRIELCTTQGVETYFVYASDLQQETQPDSQASQHSSSHSCPCTHFFMDTATTALAFHIHQKVVDQPTHSSQTPQTRPIRTTQARAPPAFIALSEDQKLA